MAAFGIAAAAGGGGGKACTDRMKARYYYMEGLRHQTEGNNPQAYEYYRKAVSADPSYPEAASAFGMLRLASSLDTLQSRPELARSMMMLRPFVDTYPEDYNEALYYAYIATRIDSLKEAQRVYERTYALRPDLTSILVSLADTYMADGEYEKSLATLGRYEEIEGRDPQLTIKKISYRMTRRDTVGAIAEASALVDYNPAEPAYRILKGNMFQLAGVNDSVLLYFKEAERLNPDYGAAKLALADFYRQQGDSAAYDEKTYEALLSEDFDLHQKIYLLEEYLQKLINDRQNTARGDHLFSVLSNQYPHEPSVLDLAARYSAAKGNFKEACEEISYAIDLAPAEEKYRGQLMSYQVADGRPGDALATYREAARHTTTPSRSLRLLYASAAQLAEEYDLAVETYSGLIRDLSPAIPTDSLLTAAAIPAGLGYSDLEEISQLFTSIGDCHYGDKDIPRAFRAYDNALLFFPDNSMALNNYAYFLVENGGDLEKAADMSSRSIAGENADNPTFLDTYAWILYRKGDFEEAKKYQASAVEISEREDNTSAELYDHYGDILLACGDRAAALDNWRKALTLDPDNNGIKQKIRSNEHN